MAIKPILFNTEMVRAILDGRKNCTRRAVKHNVEAVLNSQYHMEHPEVEDAWLIGKRCMPPYELGDVLYVRETWCKGSWGNEKERYYYKADDNDFLCTWHPSIHMPKEAARIWLKVTSVRVERLQEITEAQAEKEGFIPQGLFDGNEITLPATYWFSKFWNFTIKKSDLDRYGWAANPWVWVIEFERFEKPKEVRR